jgi:penicillin-binding protein 1A
MTGARRIVLGVLAGGTALVLATGAAAWLLAPWLERAVRGRLEREAAGRGWKARVESVHIALWPPLRLEGLRVEKPGVWSLEADAVALRPRLWTLKRLGGAHLDLGRARWSGPAGLDLAAIPTEWEVVTVPPHGYEAELRAPVQGLFVTWMPGGEPGRLDARLTDVPVGRLLAVGRDDLPLLDAGVLSGTVQVASTAESTKLDVALHARDVRLATLANEPSVVASEKATFGSPTDVALHLGGSWHAAEGTLDLPHWEATMGGARFSGSFALLEFPRDPRLDLSFELEHADLARLLGASGLDGPGAAISRSDGALQDGDLGVASLSARFTGRLADPRSFAVTQHLDFTPPRRSLPALEKLRGDFVHEVVLRGGARRDIVVSPHSADFIPLRDVPPLFLRTLLLAEDADFFGHRGIDLSEVPAAVLANWTRGGMVRGASTITQQLAKNLFLSRERRLGRKLQELSLTLLLEATLGKERILEIYLNVIEWGPDLYGLRPAARRYFDRAPRELTPKQIAFLVALIPGPLKYQRSISTGAPSPGFRPLIDELLAKLRSVGALSEEDYETALAEELTIGTADPAAPDAEPATPDAEPPP